MEDDRTSLLEQEVAKLRAEGIENQNKLDQILAAMPQQQPKIRDTLKTADPPVRRQPRPAPPPEFNGE
jgi:capsule polysaccharide export protein KpsE/RkpR